MKTILVTGGNSGIGLALCKQLCKDHGAKVFLASRNAERGAAAVQQVKDHCSGGENNNKSPVAVELLVMDVGNDDSVKAAAESLVEKSVTLHAIVNNAGTGLAHTTTGADILNVNVLGPKRVVEHFMPFLDPSEETRIVNVGSGAGPNYVKKQPQERQERLCNPDISLKDIVDTCKVGVTDDDPAKGDPFTSEYGLSKALLACYTMYLAKTYASKNVLAYCLSPGFIATEIIPENFRGRGKPVEEGTVSIRHCLFEATKEQSGWFFGSDAKRSPLHVLRNPGEPEFDGKLPWLN